MFFGGHLERLRLTENVQGRQRGDKVSKTVEQLKAEGTYRPDRHKNRLQVKGIDALKPPAHFKGEYLAKWKEVTKYLADFGILHNVDFDSITTYVESVIMQRLTYLEVVAEGPIVDGKANPAIKAYQNLETIIKPLREQFGFTPRSRQGMNVQNKVEEKVDPILEILSKKKAV